MKKNSFEIFMGSFVILITIIFTLIVLKIANKKFNVATYTTFAVFDNIEGVNVGTKVKIGGIDIGSVKEASIDKNYRVKLKLNINEGVQIPNDSTVIIATSGIIGGKYLKIQVGGSNDILKNKDEFEFTQSTMDLEDLIGKFLLNKK